MCSRAGFYGFELLVLGQKDTCLLKKQSRGQEGAQRELRNLTLNYLEWGINDVAIRVIKPDVSVGKRGGVSFRRVRPG